MSKQTEAVNGKNGINGLENGDEENDVNGVVKNENERKVNGITNGNLWKPIKSSFVALNTINPIRQIIDNMVINPNPTKKMIPLSIGNPLLFLIKLKYEFNSNFFLSIFENQRYFFTHLI